VLFHTIFALAGNRFLSNSQEQFLCFSTRYTRFQDEGSQLVALLTDARPGMDVVDFCAGGGGKALALAATMAVTGKIVGRLTATDISAYRLERMAPRLQRAGAERIRSQVVSAKDDDWIAKNSGRMDRVLVDVPCTGTGAWRRDCSRNSTPASLHHWDMP